MKYFVRKYHCNPLLCAGTLCDIYMLSYHLFKINSLINQMKINGLPLEISIQNSALTRNSEMYNPHTLNVLKSKAQSDRVSHMLSTYICVGICHHNESK